MKEKFFVLIDDESGVSPVIGVILMVAITVILAAVIGTFVLGLGDSLEQAPQAQLDAEYDGSNLAVSHNGGDSIAAADLKIVVEGGNTITSDSSESGVDAEFSPNSGDFSVGDTITMNSGVSGTDAQVQVIHEPSESIILDVEVTFP